MLPRNLKYVPGQRVRINEQAYHLGPDYVGMYGHIGIGGISVTHYFLGQYFVTVQLETGATVILQLPEQCLEDAPVGFRL